MTKPIIFGEIKGIAEGYQFEDRRIMMKDSFRRNWAGGIDGTGKAGVAVTVLSGATQMTKILAIQSFIPVLAVTKVTVKSKLKTKTG